MKTKYFFALSLAIYCNNFTTVAQTWTQASARYPYATAVAMSADGCKLAATASTSHVVSISSDSGNTWQTNQSPGLGCFAIASSADGTKWVAPDCGSAPAIFVSTNSGSNWMMTTAPIANYTTTCSSALGNVLAAARINSGTSGFMYVSTNSGLTWNTNTVLNKQWTSVVSSADGSKLAAAASGDKIYVSTDFGTTWTATHSTNDYWFSIACSADGTKLIASGSATYISTNFGVQWTLVSTNAGHVASSADGTKLIIAGTYYYWSQNPNRSIYTSSDSGVTWVSNNAPVLEWNAVASSADGSELVAAGDGEIWISQTTPSPRINIGLINSNLVLSWLVPSTNFVLQQSSDLTIANWITLTNAPSFDPASLQNQITLLQSNASPCFFRLSAH